MQDITAKAQEFIEESKLLEQAEVGIRKIFSGLPGDTELKEITITAVISGMRECGAQIYAGLFSSEELDKMLAWARTDVARKARELQPLIMSRCDAALGPYVTKAQSEYLRKAFDN